MDRGAPLPGQRRVLKRMYNPRLNKSQEIEVNPKSLSDDGPFVKSFTGFSNKNPKGLKCGHCGRRGHLISSCPGNERRVSLTQNRVTLTPRGSHNPDSDVAADGISPHDSVSQLGLTTESLRLHNKRLRRHGWDVVAPKSPPKSTAVAKGGSMGPPPPPCVGSPGSAGSGAATTIDFSTRDSEDSREGETRFIAKANSRGTIGSKDPSEGPSKGDPDSPKDTVKGDPDSPSIAKGDFGTPQVRSVDSTPKREPERPPRNLRVGPGGRIGS